MLRSLPSKFDHVVTAIGESKDLTVYSTNELMGSLLAYEERMNRSMEKSIEHAFQSKVEVSKKKENNESSSNHKSVGRGRGRGGYRGRRRGHKISGHAKSDSEKSNQSYKWRQCNYCKKYGHNEDYCWEKKGKEEANFSEQKNEKGNLFLTCVNSKDSKIDVWFVDIGCSSYMTGAKGLFRNINEDEKLEVRLGDNKCVQVERKGTIAVKTKSGIKELIHDVYYIPGLAQNLLSVGELIRKWYYLLF